MIVTGLNRTRLSSSEKSELAASAFALQGQYGAVSELSRTFCVCRESVYNAASTADAVLDDFFTRAASCGAQVVTVDDPQIARAAIAMRVIGAHRIRAVQKQLPIVYPGVRRSYGSLQAILSEAERRAAVHNTKDDLAAIKAGAVDEMFSQGDPVLAGVDLDRGFLFALELRDSRGGEDWADVLRKGQQQGLDRKVVVKDAGLGMAAGVSSVFPEAEQRDDCFHALYEIGKVRQRLERRAYALIAAEYEAALASEREKKTLRGSRSSRARKAPELRRARERAAKAVENYDHFERAARAAQEALELADAQTGELRTPQEMQARLEAAGQQMKSMDHKHCRRVGKYLIHRSPGLALHMAQVQSHFAELENIHGADAVRAASRAYRNACDIRDGKRPWEKTTQQAHVRSAISAMESHPRASELLLASIDTILQNRHRASSAMEGFNAARRPHLYVHKGVTQGFLELFRFYDNRRRRRWGRHKGTSALEVLSGSEAGDWLTELGFPSSTDAIH